MSAEIPRRGSLARRLAVAFILTALVSVTLVGVLFVGLLRLTSVEATLAELRRQADAVVRERPLLEREPRQAFRLLRAALGLSDAALYRFGADGDLALVTGSEVVPAAQLDAEKLAAGKAQEGRLPNNVVYVARPLGAPTRAVAVLSREAGPSRQIRGDVAGRLVLSALVAVGLAALAAFWLARRVSRPMKELANATAAIAKGDFDSRVPISSLDEIGVVAESFNRMAADLAQADQKQREFFLSISHELRTPLTAIQGYAEAIEDGTVSGRKEKEAAGVIVGETRRLSRLVADLLDLARIDARQFEISLDEVEIETVLHAVRQAFAPKAREAEIEIGIESSARSVRADRDRLIQVLSNLVENALRYTPAGKPITLSSRQANGWAEIRVTDGGVGFEPKDLPRAFERQYLWHKYRGHRDVGTGLGLAITRELVVAMGGSVEARNATGGGAEFAIRLPSTAQS